MGNRKIVVAWEEMPSFHLTHQRMHSSKPWRKLQNTW